VTLKIEKLFLPKICPRRYRLLQRMHSRTKMFWFRNLPVFIPKRSRLQ
jgi:hypothetical protein